MKKNMLKRLGSILIATALALLFAQPVPAQDSIKIGSVLSVTGPAAFLGDPEDKTLRLYVERINAAGGVNGKKLEFIGYDDAGDANKARTFATRLVEEDKVVAVVGGTTTGTSLAMMQVFEDGKIPFISLGGAIEIVQPVRGFVFKTPQTDKMACEKIFGDAKSRGLTKVGLISSNDGFGKSMRTQCLQTATLSGIEIVADETHGPQDADTTPQLTKIKNASGIQAVIHTGFGQHGAVVTRNYRQLGIQLPFYESHGVASKSFIQLAGSQADGVRLPAPALLLAENLPDNDPQKPIVVAYKQTYEKAVGQPVSAFGGYAYDGLQILVEALKRAGSTDPAKIRDEIEGTKGFIGTGGIVNMSATDHLGLNLSAFKMLEVKNGDWVLVQLGN
jgi:branched-chain amino acid transport system substrate-binding protein